MTPKHATGCSAMAVLIKVTLLVQLIAPVWSHPTGFENCYGLRNACAEEVCDCKCDLWDLPLVYEIQCPSQSDKVRLHLEPTKYFKIDCPTNNDEFQHMPHMQVGFVESVMIKECKIPPLTPIVDILKRFGIPSTKRLFITNNQKEFPFRSHHFKGLDLQRLSINSRTLEHLDDDLFAEIANITWLEIKNTKVQHVKTALSKLTKLKTFEMPTNSITALEPGAFEGLHSLERLSLYSNQLKSIGRDDFKGLSNVHTLELLANQIETIHGNAFDSMVALTTIGLTKNRFHALPEGLFKANSKLTEVKLLYNNVSTLPTDLFANLPNLELVHLNNAGVVTIPETLFQGSTGIKNITLNDNSIRTLLPGTFASLGSLLRLELQRNKIDKLHRDLFNSCRQMVYLDLSYNQIESLENTIFSNQLNLLHLNLQNNLLTTVSSPVFHQLVNLHFLNMSNNKLDFSSTISHLNEGNVPTSPLQNMKRLEELDLSNNSLRFVHVDFRQTMVHLRKLNLNHNNISELSYNDIHFLSTGIEVDLSYNQISYINFDHFDLTTGAQDDQNPQFPPQVKLKGNPLNCDCGMLEFAKFLQRRRRSNFLRVDTENILCASPAQLQERKLTEVDQRELTCSFDDIGGSINQTCPDQCTCLLRKVDLALVIDCSNQRLTQVPPLPLASAITYNHTILNVENCSLNALPSIALPGYAEVRELNARSNNISEITEENLPAQIRVVDLSHNRLSAVSQAVTARFNATQFLLAGNHWPCDCGMKDLLNSMQAHRQMIVDYEDMRCDTELEELISNKTISELCPQEMNLVIILLIVMSCLAIVVGLLSALYYKYQQEIKIWLYWHGIMPFLFNSDFLDSDKKYDAFISYSHQDEDFVTDHLMPELEHKRRFNLCIHRRDWTPGDFIPQQIARSVSESRRTIIVLSPSYLESLWGTMEFRAAHRAALEDQVNRVIVVIYGKVDREKLDPEMKSYIDMNTYIEWGDPWFWERLHYALRTIQTRKKEATGKKLEKTPIKGSVDDKLELINPSPLGSPLATPPAEYPMNYKQNGHVNGAFIINTNSKQSDV